MADPEAQDIGGNDVAADPAAQDTAGEVAKVVPDVPVMSATEFAELASQCTYDKHPRRGNIEQWLSRPCKDFVVEKTSGKGLKWDSSGNGLNPKKAIPVFRCPKMLGFDLLTNKTLVFCTV